MSAANTSTTMTPASEEQRVSLRRRLTHATLCGIIIAVLGWWSWYSDPDVDLPVVIANAQAFAGREVVITDEPILESVEDDWFTVRCRNYRIRVAATISPDHVGEFVYVRGTFHPAHPDAPNDGLLSHAAYRVAAGRRAKIWLSVIPVIWIAVLLLRHVRINTTRWSIELRN
jgi:hypothetical protein